jgi:hypothetical protein
MRIGHTGSENNEEFVVLNNERYFYAVNNDSDPSLTIYKESKNQPLAVCELAVGEKDMMIDLSGKTSLKEDAKFSLLMTLCWYLFYPAKTERPLEYNIG